MILNEMLKLCCVILKRMPNSCFFDLLWDAFYLLCDFVLEDALCVVELMELANCIETTPHGYNSKKECDKRLSRGRI